MVYNGIHVEGPYLNVEQKGAQQKDLIRKPDPIEYKKWFESGTVKLITVAPEIEGADGKYDYYGWRFTVTDGIARTPEGGLSGSTLMLDQALKNMIKFTDMSFTEVLPMATSVPAEAMGWSKQRGVLKPGADADVVILNDDLTVEKTFILGKEIFSK